MISSCLVIVKCYPLINPPIRLVKPFIINIIPASPVARIPIVLSTSSFLTFPARGKGKNQREDPIKKARKAI